MNLLFLALLVVQTTEPAIVYEVRLDNADHHEADIRAVFTDVPAGVLELRMSRSSPGRYALHEFAKNVYDVRVTDGAGGVLEVTRPDPHGWNVNGHRGHVEVRYKIFGDRIDGTYLAIDNTHAHVVFEQNPSLEVVTFERAGRAVTLAIETFRKAWLTSALEHDLDKHCHECGRSFAFENDFCPHDGRKLDLVPKP